MEAARHRDENRTFMLAGRDWTEGGKAWARNVAHFKILGCNINVEQDIMEWGMFQK